MVVGPLRSSSTSTLHRQRRGWGTHPVPGRSRTDDRLPWAGSSPAPRRQGEAGARSGKSSRAQEEELPSPVLSRTVPLPSPCLVLSHVRGLRGPPAPGGAPGSSAPAQPQLPLLPSTSSPSSAGASPLRWRGARRTGSAPSLVFHTWQRGRDGDDALQTSVCPSFLSGPARAALSPGSPAVCLALAQPNPAQQPHLPGLGQTSIPGTPGAAVWPCQLPSPGSQ